MSVVSSLQFYPSPSEALQMSLSLAADEHKRPDAAYDGVQYFLGGRPDHTRARDRYSMLAAWVILRSNICQQGSVPWSGRSDLHTAYCRICNQHNLLKWSTDWSYIYAAPCRCSCISRSRQATHAVSQSACLRVKQWPVARPLAPDQ